MVPAKVPAFSFYATLLVAFPRRTELGLKTPMRSEGDESRRLLSPVPAQNPFHRTAEVVIAKLCKYAAKISEPQLVRFQKGLLAGMWKGAMERSATGHAPHAKYIGLLSLLADVHIGFIPVHLSFLTPPIGLWNAGFLADESQLRLSLAHVATNRGLACLYFRHLCSNPAPDPMRGVPLLPRRLLVRGYNRLDEGNGWRELGLRSNGFLAFWGDGVGQCLPYHSPVDPQLLSHTLDRSSTMLVLASDLFK